MKPIVTLQGVGKRYVKYEDLPLLMTRALRFRASHLRTHLWALRYIDLEVEQGESVGVIGRNGSGKSTMFRMLAGVTAPTEGLVRVDGRVAPLISVGVGFHPELTGRENVYLNGAILGLSSAEIDRRFDSIVDFAEIGEFIDTPVKFYSTGMFVRLGFSVAVASQPEILLVDEVLSVGDVAFQKRCFDRMEEIRSEGATVLVVSHNMNAISKLCSRTLLLDNGTQLFLGDTEEAISMFYEALDSPIDADEPEIEPERSMKAFTLSDEDGKPTGHVSAGEEVTFGFEAVLPEDAEGVVVGLWIHARDRLVYSEHIDSASPVRAGEVTRGAIRIRVALGTGSYKAKMSIRSGFKQEAMVVRSRPLSFFVSGRPNVTGVDLGATLEIRNGSSS